MTLQKVMASAFSIRNLTKIKMEILFVFLGAVAILFELSAYAKIEKVNELRYKKSVGMVLDSQEQKDLYGNGCASLFSWAWLWIGVLTTEWFLCLVALMWSIIDYVAFAENRKPVWYEKFTTILMIVLIVFIILNISQFHIDVTGIIKSWLINS